MAKGDKMRMRAEGTRGPGPVPELISRAGFSCPWASLKPPFPLTPPPCKQMGTVSLR